MKSTRTATAILACLLLLSGSAHSAEREILVEIEIRGMSALTNAIAVAAAVLELQPQTAAATQNIRTKLTPRGATGLRETGIIRTIIFTPDEDARRVPPDYVVLLPAQDDGSLLLAQFGEPVAPLSAKDAVGEYASQAIPGQPGGNVFAAVAGRHLVFGENRDLVDMITARVRSGVLAPAAKTPVRGVVAFKPNMAAIARLFTKMMSDSAAAMKDMPQAQAGGMDPAAILNAEADALKDILSQFRSCALGLAVSRKSISIYTRAEGDDDTWMARSFAAARKPDPIYYKLLPEHCFWTQSGHWSALESFMDGYNTFLSKIYRGMGPQWRGTEQIVLDATEKLDGIFPGDYAYGMLVGSDGSPFGGVMCTAVTDPARMQKVIDESIDAFQAKLGELEAEGMKISIERGDKRAYKGTPIQAYRYSFAMPAQAATMTPGMGALSNIAYEIAYADKMCVVTMGPTTEMDRALDRIKNPGQNVYDQAGFKELFPKISGEPVRVSTFSILGYMRMVMTIMMGAAPPMPAAAGPGICSYAVVRDGIHYSATRVSFDELKTLKMIPMLMMGAGGMPAPGAPRPSPARPAP